MRLGDRAARFRRRAARRAPARAGAPRGGSFSGHASDSRGIRTTGRKDAPGHRDRRPPAAPQVHPPTDAVARPDRGEEVKPNPRRRPARPCAYGPRRRPCRSGSGGSPPRTPRARGSPRFLRSTLAARGPKGSGSKPGQGGARSEGAAARGDTDGTLGLGGVLALRGEPVRSGIVVETTIGAGGTSGGAAEGRAGRCQPGATAEAIGTASSPSIANTQTRCRAADDAPRIPRAASIASPSTSVDLAAASISANPEPGSKGHAISLPLLLGVLDQPLQPCHVPPR